MVDRYLPRDEELPINHLDSPTVGLRICFVTPFAWSQPHEVNTHVAGTAAALRRLGHEVTVLAPSNRARDLLAGRRALQRGTDPEVIAVGPSIPISRRSSMGVPVGVRANLTLALVRGRYDVVHGFEPGLPSLSYLALTSTHALTAATFFSPDRLSYPPRRSRRDRLRARVDALLATSPATAEAAAERFEGDYTLIPLGVDSALFRPATKRSTIALELEPGGRSTTRAVARLLRELEGWELSLLHTKPLGFRPPIPRDVRRRAHVRAVRRPAQRAAALGEAAIFVPAPEGEERLALEAASAGAAVVAIGEDVVAQVAQLASDDELRERVAEEGRPPADAQSFDRVAQGLDAVYSRLVGKPHRRTSEDEDPLAGRDWVVVDLHMHTDWSHDCSIPVMQLLDHAEAIGLGAIE